MTMFAILGAASAATAFGQTPLPADIVRQLPRDYDVLAAVKVSAGRPARSFEIVALGHGDDSLKHVDDTERPLLIFEQKGGRFVPAGRNDHVVMKADEGGQCDPFLDGDAKIAVKGGYFTVQNGVACGEHWTDYITFRLASPTGGGFVFDNERREAWSLNPSDDPNAQALVRDGKPTVIRDHAGQVTTFSAWRPKD
jgi:hypothetical protein